jgi:hypothetical protein
MARFRQQRLRTAQRIVSAGPAVFPIHGSGAPRRRLCGPPARNHGSILVKDARREASGFSSSASTAPRWRFPVGPGPRSFRLGGVFGTCTELGDTRWQDRNDFSLIIMPQARLGSRSLTATIWWRGRCVAMVAALCHLHRFFGIIPAPEEMEGDPDLAVHIARTLIDLIVLALVDPSRRRFPGGSSRRWYAISQNHLFTRVARKYVHFGQTALARKGLEETELLPAKRASEQSSVGHWTNCVDESSSFVALRNKLYCIISLSMQQNHASLLQYSRWSPE